MPDEDNNFGGSLVLDFRVMTSRATQESIERNEKMSRVFASSLTASNTKCANLI